MPTMAHKVPITIEINSSPWYAVETVVDRYENQTGNKVTLDGRLTRIARIGVAITQTISCRQRGNPPETAMETRL